MMDDFHFRPDTVSIVSLSKFQAKDREDFRNEKAAKCDRSTQNYVCLFSLSRYYRYYVMFIVKDVYENSGCKQKHVCYLLQ